MMESPFREHQTPGRISQNDSGRNKELSEEITRGRLLLFVDGTNLEFHSNRLRIPCLLHRPETAQLGGQSGAAGRAW